ncbi:MAG TPA: type II toxin-antitoxin system VapC family toxin [Candidatus Binataceae bacterium]|nr:type II toxin-antitoxin system VapC family toxin [Candidatus Binataceae bacterium]
MIAYFDTSALVKLYADEPGAKSARAAALEAELIATSIISYAEIRSAFARKLRFADITAAALNRFKEQFEHSWESFQIVPIEENTVRQADELAETHGLKGFDAVHLASANLLGTRLGKVTFACFDTELSLAASACGMTLLSVE